MIDAESVINTALRVARERYLENAKELDGIAGHARLAEQFRHQAKEADAVANKIEDGQVLIRQLV